MLRVIPQDVHLSAQQWGGSGLLPTLARQEPGNAASAQAEFLLILMERQGLEPFGKASSEAGKAGSLE